MLSGGQGSGLALGKMGDPIDPCRVCPSVLHLHLPSHKISQGLYAPFPIDFCLLHEFSSWVSRPCCCCLLLIVYPYGLWCRMDCEICPLEYWYFVLSAHMRKPIYCTRWETQPFGFCTLLQPTLIEHQVPAWVLQPTPWQQNRSWPGFVAELVPPIVWPTYSAIVVGVDLSSTGEAERQLANLSSHLQARRPEEGNDGLACCFTRRCSCAPVTPSSVL